MPVCQNAVRNVRFGIDATDVPQLCNGMAGMTDDSSTILRIKRVDANHTIWLIAEW